MLRFVSHYFRSIADDCLRDVYVRGKYRDVILPMFVLRRLDCLLESTKDAVLEEVRFQREEAGLIDEAIAKKQRLIELLVDLSTKLVTIEYCKLSPQTSPID